MICFWFIDLDVKTKWLNMCLKAWRLAKIDFKRYENVYLLI